jgi:hypothetical protein
MALDRHLPNWRQLRTPLASSCPTFEWLAVEDRGGFTHIIDDPLVLAVAGSVSSAIRLGWSVGEALLFVGGLLEE